MASSRRYLATIDKRGIHRGERGGGREGGMALVIGKDPCAATFQRIEGPTRKVDIDRFDRLR